MTLTLKPFNFVLVLLFLAFAAAFLLLPHTNAPVRNRPLAAVMHIGDTESVEIQFVDYPDEWHENDCGLTIYLRIVRRMPRDRTDPCTLLAISWQELYARTAAYLKKQGIQIDLPNGLSKDVLYALGQDQRFVDAVKVVLDEIAKSQGLGDNIAKYLTDFPFDAFTR